MAAWRWLIGKNCDQCENTIANLWMLRAGIAGGNHCHYYWAQSQQAAKEACWINETNVNEPKVCLSFQELIVETEFSNWSFGTRKSLKRSAPSFWVSSPYVSIWRLYRNLRLKRRMTFARMTCIASTNCLFIHVHTYICTHIALSSVQCV